MVKPLTELRLPVYDWTLPVKHLASVREVIEDAAIHLSQSGAETALMIDVRPLEHRYQAGERSPELYDLMMKARFR